MALLLKRGASFTPAPIGLHHAICIRIIDLGTQKSQFAGKVKIQPKIMLIWELLGEKQADGRPYIVSKQYNATLNENSTLQEHLRGWLGKSADGIDEFDLTHLLGKACAVNVAHKPSKDGSRIWAEIASVSPAMTGFQAPQPSSTPAAFDLSDPDWALFAEFSEFTQKIICQSPEYAALVRPDGTPPPINTALEVKMAVDDDLFELLKNNIAAGKTTAQEVLSMGYEFTEQQRLWLES